MASASGRFQMVFNGEIYNHLDLRRRLCAGTSWRGGSDTESLLAAIEAVGIEQALKLAIGMFAIAVWDSKERTLTLARDRLGEKPLYYGWQGSTFMFASQVSALAAHPHFEGSIDHGALMNYLTYGYVPAPASIYNGIRKVSPGTAVTVSLLRPKGTEGQVTQYWALSEIMKKGADQPFRGSSEEASIELERLLTAAVTSQLASDVPLGAFLSGGIDSSIVVALMQQASSTPVRTFTIGFSDAAYDESAAARAVADHLGTDHTEIILTPADALSVVPRLGAVYDEPFADSSAIPTWLVAALARQHVTVALSGDGGDELFAGYRHYLRTDRVWQKFRRLPRPLRLALLTGVGLLPSESLGSLTAAAGTGSPQLVFRERVRNLNSSLRATDIKDFYRGRITLWPNAALALNEHTEPPSPWAFGQETGRTDAIEHMMAMDLRMYLPDDILVKVDRAAMSHSLETRVPLLDARIVEFAWSLTPSHRMRAGVTKWPLRQVLYRHVPRELVDRPKQGFSVPIPHWLRGELRPWAEELLSTQALERNGLFNSKVIRALWQSHLDGINWHYRLWPILMYQQWQLGET